MNGIIGEIVTLLDYAEEVSNERNTYYSAFIGGSAIEEMDYFVDNGIPFSLLVKLGKDMQGETHLDYITSEYGIEEDDVLYSSAPSSISMEGTLLVKNTAPSFIKKEEVMDFIEKNHIDKIIISYESVKRISKAIPDTYISGDILTEVGVKRVSSEMIKDLFI